MATVRVGACLSLSGRYARFGAQAGQALRVWRDLAGADVEVAVADDRSEVSTLRRALPEVAARCDVLLGPYSTHLAAAAADVAAEHGLLLWNHGGAGDDVPVRHPGHVVSVPTPAARYAEPFLRLLARDRQRARLWIAHGTGRFGRQVAAGAARLAERLAIDTACVDAAEDLAPDDGWDLFTAGSFSDDVRAINHARALPHPPRVICAVAAGVSEFRHAVAGSDGIFGVAQWAAGHGHSPAIGPDEPDFVTRYARIHGSAPDYPAVQAAAAAILATHCVHLAGSTHRDALWPAAASLDTRTLFGHFRIDPHTGVQLGHDTVLVRWTPAGELRTG